MTSTIAQPVTQQLTTATGKAIRICRVIPPVFGAVLLALVFGHSAALAAEVDDRGPDELAQLRHQLNMLHQAQSSLSNELRQLKAELRRKELSSRVDPPESFLNILDPTTVLGDASAPVTLVEFADFECSFCRRFFGEIFPRIKEEYVDKGKVRYIFCHFPLSSVHPNALLAAEAACCANEQGAFWPMHDWLMTNSVTLSSELLESKAAETLGLDRASFRQCLAARPHTGLIQQEMSEAIQHGIRGTPTFFLGTADPSGEKVKVERTIKGVPPFSFFKENLEELLDRLAKAPDGLAAKQTEYLK
jgi:protein-disulfide isomerase